MLLKPRRYGSFLTSGSWPPSNFGETPPPDRQTNLTDPDSALMRRSDPHEYRQAYSAQGVVCAEGSQLILTSNIRAFARTGFAVNVRKAVVACG